jgi:predicted kinase
MLYIFGGLPGSGKTTLSQHLARERQAVHLRIDIIEQAMREAGIVVDGPQGYNVAYHLAGHNLRLGMDVIADSVNPLQITRAAWRDVAIQAGAAYVEIECICSDLVEHRRRVETRTSDIAGFCLPTWQDVINRTYEPWDSNHVVIDTAGQSEAQSIAALFRALSRL